jgi:asparagine synthase (glutamine-hydrolysing)
MCGILFYKNPKGVGESRCFERALDHMATRGPDHRRLEYGPDFAIGHTRLSIIDLSSDANQPFWDPSGRFVLSYNGEIYNFREIRKELEAAGRHLRTHSDTEVLLESLLEWGLDSTLERLRGMFAFALYDTENGRLTVARDHFGQKPVYYDLRDGCIAVASDPLSLIELRGSASPDPAAYSVYMCAAGQSGTRGAFHTDRTFFEEIQALPAGHVLTFDESGARLREYFTTSSLFDASELERNIQRPREECVDELRFEFRRAVRRHLVSDVGVGVLLSGGIDSTLVYWFAHEMHPELTSFTKISPGIESIPLEIVPRILERRPANTYLSVQQPGGYLSGLRDFVRASRAPSRWGGGPPMNQLCVDARRNGIYVLLGGDCADEYFAGYGHYESLFEQKNPDPSSLSDLVSLNANSAFRVPEEAEAYECDQRERRRRILDQLRDVAEPYERLVQATLLHDSSSFLQTCNLPHSDAYSMMTSVELRNPMLDLDLVRFAVNLPARLKVGRDISGHFGKRLMRELAKREIGDFVNVKKEGTRNFAMKVADSRYWRFGNFAIRELMRIPDEMTKREIIRLINLEIFHRQLFLGEEDFFPKIMSPTGLSEVGPAPSSIQKM